MLANKTQSARRKIGDKQHSVLFDLYYKKEMK